MNEDTPRNKRKSEGPEPASIAELKTASERLRLSLDGDWTSDIPVKHAKPIAALLHRIATSLGPITKAKSQAEKKEVSDSIFVKLVETFEQWVSREVPENHSSVVPKLAKRLGELKEQAELQQKKEQYREDLKTETNQAKRPDDAGRQEKSIQIKIDKLTKQIEEIGEQTNYLKQLIIQHKLGIESEISRTRLYTGETISRLLTEIQLFGDVIKVLEPRLVERFVQVDIQLASMRELLGSKIDIQDSLGILNLRAEIERHVAAEIISNISKALMPTIESLQISADKTAEECMEVVKTQCLKAGLIPLERLY